MSMTSHPVSVFPAISSHGNPAGVSSISFHACARALARARAIRSSMAAVPARSRARRTVGPLGASPSTGARCASRAMSLMLVAPSAIAAASDDEHDAPVEQRRRALLPQRRAQLRRSVPPGRRPCGAGSRRRGRPGPFPSAVTFRAWSHPLCCMAKSAPVRDYVVVVTRNLPGPGRSSLLKPARDGRFAAVPSHSRDTLIAPHP